MKVVYTLLLLAIWSMFSLCFSPKAVAETPTLVTSPVVLEELLVQIPANSSKLQPQIWSRLTSVNGVYVNGYCEKLKIYLLRIDRSQQPTNQFLETIFHNQFQLSYDIKQDATIEQVRTLCEMPASDADPSQSQQ